MPPGEKHLIAHNAALDSPLLVMDFGDKAELPPNFRSTRDPYKNEARSVPTRHGLDTLNASASGQVSESSLKNLLAVISGDVWVVDLRQEPHGFVNGTPISWYGLRNQTYADASPHFIESLEKRLLAEIAGVPTVKAHEIVDKVNGRISETLVHHLQVRRAETERELVARLGLKYQRFFITDHLHPDDQSLNQFIHFVMDRPKDAWFHFHCRSGFGRTSTFMVLLDIILNAATVGLDDIIQRHSLMGSKNLFRVADSPDKLWRYEMGARRREFIKAFYSYMKDPAGKALFSWTAAQTSGN